MKKRKHNYPSERADTGPRPMAGRTPIIDNPVNLTIRISEDDRQWLLTQAGSIAEAIRNLIAAARKAAG